MTRKYPRLCPECGAERPERSPLFCDAQHRTAFHNRNKKQGGELVPLMKAWRRARGSGPIAKAAFAAMVQLADKFIAEDREDNRPDVAGYVESRGWYGAPDKKTGQPTFHIQINVERTKRRPRGTPAGNALIGKEAEQNG